MAYSSIIKPSTLMNTVLYTGDGGTKNITGVGFQPDWIWIKSRSNTKNNALFDAVRGVTKRLSSNSDTLEATESAGVTGFVTDGFSLGGQGGYNNNGDTFVSWNWKAGTTTGIATNGSTTITPSAYSFNQTSGFSILKFTGNQTSGAKLAHGLGVKPSMIICKSMAGTSSWGVYHKSLGATYGMLLNTTGIKDDDASAWNDVEPDTVNITLGSSVNTNKTGDMVAYCFAEKIGYSKVGIYKGNNNVNGTFVYTGFAPKFLMVKQSNADGNPWAIVDTTRNTFNHTNKQLFPSGTADETTNVDVIDLLSNGFKCRAVDNTWNGEAGGNKNYIYLAFGQSIVGSNDTPTTAR